MKLLLLAVTLALCNAQPHNVQKREATAGPNYTKLSEEQVRHLQNRGFGPTVPTPFRPTAAVEEQDEEDELDEDISPASTQVRRPVYSEQDAYIQNVIPVQVRPQPRPQQQQQPQQQQVYRRPPQQQYHQEQRPQQQYRPSESKDKGKVTEEEEEIEEPDRLSLLLPQSKFDCTAKNTGYYADEDLGCEVFHYCQDNAKHSWICPEGFTFHQVHLICMPPGGDNICAKSSQFHFVNEYLYKPLNLEEHQRKPNISLKYSDRYYPDNYYNHNNYDEEEESEEAPQQYHHHQRKPIRVGLQQQVPAQQQQVIQVVRGPSPTKFAPTQRAESSGQVFRSPEEVNISLQQRRPQYLTQRYREEAGY